MWSNSRFHVMLLVVTLVILSQLYISLTNLASSKIVSNLYITTKDIQPLPIHSHNDEWRHTPFITAYQHGAQSIELDCWGLNDMLYVGHNKNYLNKRWTLQELYLNPIFDILSDANSITGDRQNGVWYNDPGLTLYLYIDVKLPNGTHTIRLLTDAIANFIERDWITYYDEEEIQWKPVTIIITGNYPLLYLSNLKGPRFFFIDSPWLELINDESFINNYKPGELSITTTASLRQLLMSNKLDTANGFSDSQFNKLEQYIAKAHDLNLHTRIWETPNWPIRLRNKIWLQLLELKVDSLNVDSLKDLVSYF